MLRIVKMHVLRDLLKIIYNLLIHSAYRFKKALGILSGPLPFFVSRLSNKFKIPGSVMNRGSRALSLGSRFRTFPFSVVKTDWK